MHLSTTNAGTKVGDGSEDKKKKELNKKHTRPSLLTSLSPSYSSISSFTFEAIPEDDGLDDYWIYYYNQHFYYITDGDFIASLYEEEKNEKAGCSTM
jgi:hypothetical protein